MTAYDLASEDGPRVIEESSGTWLVRLDGGLRVDTHFGLARAVSKIPFEQRKQGGGYRLIDEFTARSHRWARIKRIPE